MCALSSAGGPRRRFVLRNLAAVGASLCVATSVWAQDQYRGLDAQRCAVTGCGGGARVQRVDPGPTAADLAYDEYSREEDAAVAAHDYAKALSIARKRQQLRDGPNIRKWINMLEYDVAMTAGSDAYAAGDYDRAVALFQEALKHFPTYAGALHNLQLAQDAQRATEHSRRVAESQGAISSGTSALIDSAGPGKAAGAPGLSFMPAPSPPAADASVVDARNVPTGLPDEVAAEIPRTPAGDRVRKGFQAIAQHDWPVALAWFQEAANLEPQNVGLRRLVDLAQDGVARTRGGTSGPSAADAKPDAKGGGPVHADDWQIRAEVADDLRRYNEAHPQAADAASNGAADKPADSGQPGPNWKAFFDALFGPAGITRRPTSVAGVRD
jgi:tetratricopeptide (TPR) repeat protein